MSEAERSEGKDRKGHWRSLMETLGLSMPADPEPAPGDQSPLADEVVAEPRAAEQEVGLAAETEQPAPQHSKPARPLPPRPRSDWYGLATQLGIEVEPPPAPDEAGSSATVQDRGPETPAEEKPEPIASPTSWGVSDDAVHFVGFEQEEVFELEVSSLENVDFGEPDSSETQVVAMDELDQTTDEDAELTPPAESSETVSRRRRRRGRRRSGTGERERTAPPVSEENDDEPDMEMSDASDVDAETEEDEAGEAEEAATTSRSRRSRRRRRRPTRRETESDAPQDDVTVDDEADDDSDEDDGDDDDDESHASRAGGSRSKHQKIPTWEEAISVMVSNNMQSRSRSSSSKGKPRSSRRRRN